MNSALGRGAITKVSAVNIHVEEQATAGGRSRRTNQERQPVLPQGARENDEQEPHRKNERQKDDSCESI